MADDKKPTMQDGVKQIQTGVDTVLHPGRAIANGTSNLVQLLLQRLMAQRQPQSDPLGGDYRIVPPRPKLDMAQPLDMSPIMERARKATSFAQPEDVGGTIGVGTSGGRFGYNIDKVIK